jgi:hypothetical protein
MIDIKNPLCRDCKFYRQTSNTKFVCGKFNIEMAPLSRNELKYGCWEEKVKDEILDIRPNFYGIGFNVRAVWKKISNFLSK